MIFKGKICVWPLQSAAVCSAWQVRSWSDRSAWTWHNQHWRLTCDVNAAYNDRSGLVRSRAEAHRPTLWRIIPLSFLPCVVSRVCASAVCWSISNCLPVWLSMRHKSPSSNFCLSSPIPPSPPECNKCPAVIYFNSLPSCADEMDS